MSELDKIQKTAEKQGAPIGLKRYDVQAMRKAARMEGRPLPKLTTPRQLLRWLDAHPDFVPSRVFKKSMQPSPAQDQAPATAGISGE